MRQISSSTGAPLSGRKGSRNDGIMPKTPTVVDEEVDSQTADKDALWDIDSQATFQSWYPTLRKAIWLLSRIYRLVNVRDLHILYIFEQLTDMKPVHRL